MTPFPGRTALQPERTALAWQRTAITATVVMMPLLVVTARRQAWWMTVLGSMAAAAGGVLVVGVRRRFAQLRDDDQPFSPYEPMVRVAAVASVTAALGLGTALVLFLG